MPFDENLANRIRRILKKMEGVSEKKMFGGLCFLVNGNMAMGVVNNDLMLRVGPDSYEKMFDLPHVRKMDFTGKSLKGFIYVGGEGTGAEKDLKGWVSIAVDYAKSLPPKEKK
jgi:hypothetical protein